MVSKGAWAATATLVALVSGLPYIWMVLSAFRPRMVLTASPPDFSLQWTIENFALTYSGQSLVALFINSLIISGTTVVLCMSVGVPAAYYFARHRSRWARSTFLFILSTRMAPTIAISLPMFFLFTEIGLRGTYVSVVVAQAVFNIAFVVWFLEDAISSIPTEIEMAAQVDGRSQMGALVGILVPALAPTLWVAAAFVFLFSWNEYMIASLLTSSSTRPITPALPGFLAQATSHWGSFSAVAFLSSLPALALAWFTRRYIARAFTVGLIDDA